MGCARERAGGADAAAGGDCKPARAGSCRICLQSSPTSVLEAPCQCKGTMQYAHHECVQRWIDERPPGQALLCEVCGAPFRSRLGWLEPPPRPGQAPGPLGGQLGGVLRFVLFGSPAGPWDAAPAAAHYSASASAWGLTLLLLALGVLLVRHLFRIVPDTGMTQHSADAYGSTRLAAAAIEDVSLSLVMLWVILRLLLVVPCWAAFTQHTVMDHELLPPWLWGRHRQQQQRHPGYAAAAGVDVEAGQARQPAAAAAAPAVPMVPILRLQVA